jgi:tetratricopeptide (TPR) repeat protein
MPTSQSFPDPLGDLDGRLRKELLRSRLFRGQRVETAGKRYRITHRLGAGGTGAVYAAHDRELDRTVALKLLRAAGSEQTDRDRLRREALLLARLSHPNIVVVFGFTEYEGHCAVVMELIQGRNLRAWLTQSPDAPPRRRRACEVVVAAGRALAAAHAAGVVHGDFKPENVLVPPLGAPVKILDFGLARIHTDAITPDAGELDDTLATIEGLTPAYAAPERLAGGPPDAKADQYSLCVMLWEAWTGSRPLQCGQAAPPRRVRRVLEQGLDPAPERRWASTYALLDAFEAACRPRRRWPAVATGLFAVGGGAWLLHDEAVDPCSSRRAELEAVWSPERRRNVEANLAAFDDATSTDVVASLDAHARRWIAAHGVGCRATGASDSVGRPELDRRLACLRARLQAFDALAGALETAGPVEVASARGSVASLADPAECRRGRDPPLPGRVDTLLARAEVLQNIGRAELALALLDSAKAEDEAAAVAVGLRRASVLATLDRREEARSLLERLYLQAVATGQEPAAARAAIAIVFNVRPGAIDREASITWLRHASTMLERSPGDVDLELELEHARAQALRFAGARVEAMDLFKRLEPEVARRYGRGGARWVQVRFHRAGACREAGRFDRERELAADGLEAARRVLGDEHRLTLDMEAMWGGALVQLGRADEARAVLTKTRAVFERIHGEEHEALQYLHVDLADLADLEGDLEQSREHYDTALAILHRRLGRDSHEAIALLNKRASVIWRLGDTHRATKEFHRAFDLALALGGKSSPRTLEVLNDLLVHQGRAGDWDAAAETLARGREWLAHIDDALVRARFMYNEGVIETHRGDRARGIELLQRALELAGMESAELAIETRMRLADAYVAAPSTARDRDQARVLVDEAAAIARSMGRSDSPQRDWLHEHTL